MDLVGQRATRSINTALILFVATLSACMGYVPGRKDYWDAKVKELCEKDGGVTVYEKVAITREEYERLGGTQGTIPVPDERRANGALYFSRSSTQELNPANPRVARFESEVIRRADGKRLGRVVSYSRTGGDMPTGLGHDSSFSCHDVSGARPDIGRQIFEVIGAAK